MGIPVPKVKDLPPHSVEEVMPTFTLSMNFSHFWPKVKFSNQCCSHTFLKGFSNSHGKIVKYTYIYTYLQNKRMRRCGVPTPPQIIFERLKLPQQIIYRRKENLSESPNHQKYWENILVSQFYEQFSRKRRNLGHFRKFEKISNS